MSSRFELRQRLRNQRKSLSPEFRSQSSQTILKRLMNLPIFHKSQHIALYLPYHAEVDISSLASQYPNKNYYLPILAADQHLEFGHYSLNASLKPNIFGILEPITKTYQPAQKLDLVCLPLVGFDKNGNRLGMGGGFYDRSFAFKQKNHKPFLLGIAFECQKVEQLEAENWDVTLDAVITEQDFYSL